MTRFVRKPVWRGWHATLVSRTHFKVKLLKFGEGGSLSRQYHHHRSELWLFLSGRGVLWKGACWFPAERGDAIAVERGEVHTFRADKPTLVMEIQYGEKCEEEDIVRV